MTKPFQVETSDINGLNAIQLTQLLKILLHAEAHNFGIVQRSVEVALNITTGDGGEDGRISWQGSPEFTDYIPNKNTLFQNKATKMAPKAYGQELLTKARKNNPPTVKKEVDDMLSNGGSYIVFTTQELNTKQKKDRLKAMRETFVKYDKSYAKDCDLHIYDASQIAGWVNRYLPAIVSVLHWIGRPIERGLKSYNLWQEYPDLSLYPFVEVDSRSNLVTTLKNELLKPRSCCRIIGLSGLGKTRTAFQIFYQDEVTKNLLVYVDANHCSRIDALISDWISLNYQAILVVDNCEYRLHESLVREISRENSQISLLSIDYNFEQVSQKTLVKKLEPMADDELLSLLKPRYKGLLPDLERIVRFAQGFPQMAVLLAQARLNEDPRVGELTEDELANKLLWKRDEAENKEHLKILQICSLFDSFGIEDEVQYELEYISELANLDINIVYECIQKYSERGIIDRRGRFGQVVPKPLAIRLAGQWWKNARQEKQRKLLNEIPEGMVGSFCSQVEKMSFHSNVKNLTEQLYGSQAPFGQAEVILSKRGSRLFCAFVSVNPEATATALNRTLCEMNYQQLLEINGDTRRHLIWGLERLYFHADLFMESAWCLLLLASAENESWSNNATGIFKQLFSVYLSGTASEPAIRLRLLKQALNSNQQEIDMVIIEALKQAIDIPGNGGIRTIGAEYQGMKAPLEEWKPSIWQEVFDYWQEAFDLLISMLNRGEAQQEKVLDYIGSSLRGFVRIGQIEMTDSVVRRIVCSHGRYWPAALNSIKIILKYDSNNLKELHLKVLNSWLDLLSIDNAELQEKLKIIVTNPPWENLQDENGNYVDIAAENSRKLASRFIGNITNLFPHLDLLLKGEQKQAYAFGKQLSFDLEDPNDLINISLERFINIKEANPNLILGMYRGLYEKSPSTWQRYIDNLLSDKYLMTLFPEFIRTGSIQKHHLSKLLELIENDILPSHKANVISYGGAINDLAPETIIDFCIKLSKIDDIAVWSALDIIFMYCFRNEEKINSIRDAIKILVTSVSLYESQIENFNSLYQWNDLIEILFKVPDEELAIKVSDQLITASQYGFNYSHLWDYMIPLLLKMMQKYGDILWPKFSAVIVEAEGNKLYWLQQLFKRKEDIVNPMPSVLSVLPVESVLSWCNRYPNLAPIFAAHCIDILEMKDGVQTPSSLFVSLVEAFGNDDHVSSALAANIGTRTGWGSLVPYLEVDKAALIPLLDHQNSNVRVWVKKYISYINKQIDNESKLDEENDLRFS